MIFLELYEAVYGRQRDDWSKAQWRDVAEQLVDALDRAPKKRGRPPLSEMEKDNIPALAFWADQEKERAFREEGKKITEKEAIKRVMQQAASREGKNRYRADAKLASAIKQVRTFRRKLEKRN